MNRFPQQTNDSEGQWFTARTARYNAKAVDLKRRVFDASTVEWCPRQVVHQYQVVPFRDSDGVVRLATATENGETYLEIADLLDRDIEFVRADLLDIENVIREYYK